MAEIFVSYASEDRARVKPIVDFLVTSGWSVWWDRNLLAGSNFHFAIETEIEQADCVIVVWTEKSVKSQWVRAEADDGRERDLLVPILLDPVRIPLAFSLIHTVQMFEDAGVADPTAREKLEGSVRSVIERSRAKRGTPAKPDHSQNPDRSRTPSDAGERADAAVARFRERCRGPNPPEILPDAPTKSAQPNTEKKHAPVRIAADADAAIARFLERSQTKQSQAIAPAYTPETRPSWCPECHQDFNEPSTADLAQYGRYWRSECPRCSAHLVMPEKKKAHSDKSKTCTACNRTMMSPGTEAFASWAQYWRNECPNCGGCLA